MPPDTRQTALALRERPGGIVATCKEVATTTDPTQWAATLEPSRYLLAVANALPPELVGPRLDLAAADLWAAVLLVEAAVATLEAVQGILDRISAEFREADLPLADADLVYQALRAQTPLGKSLDSAFAIAEALKRVL